MLIFFCCSLGSEFGPCLVMRCLVSFCSFGIILMRKRELVALL